VSRSTKKPGGRSGRYGAQEKHDRNAKVRAVPVDKDCVVRYKRGGDQEGDWGEWVARGAGASRHNIKE
jgi:hypothetical protein